MPQSEEDVAGGVGQVVEDSLPHASATSALVVLIDPVPQYTGGDQGFGVAGNSSSPAICSCTKRSYGLSALKLLTT